MTTIFLQSFYNRFADIFIMQVFFIISCLNLFVSLFCICISRANGLKKILILLHYSFILIQFILLSDYIILIFKLYYNVNQMTKSYINKKFLFFLAHCVKYVITILVALYITTIT